MVEIYGDESETTGTPRVFSLVVCIGVPSGWNSFVPKWREMLCDTGPYPVPAFHAIDAAQGQNEFEGWTIDQREAFYARALDLVFDTTLVANMYVAGCAIVVDDFSRAIPDGWKPSVADLYVKCFETVFRTAFSFSPVMGANFILDEKDKVKGRVVEMFNTARKNLPPELIGRLGSLTFADDRKVIPLQVADLIAYEWRRRVWERRANPNIGAARPQYLRLRNGFKRLSDAKQPPYRTWNMRCYDKQFISGFTAVPLPNVDLSELWFEMKTSED